MRRTIGSLFSGTGAFDLAVARVYDADPIWHVENDPGAQAVLRHHYPDVKLYDDVTTVDWAGVEPPDILTGGFPCQDVSPAGRRAGLIRSGDTANRSGLWAYMCDAIDELRPGLVVIENVRGLLHARADSNVEPCPWCLGDEEGEPALRALGAVLGDLADIGYDAQWHGLRAADVGAPHARFRIFIVAARNAEDAVRRRRRAVPGIGARDAGQAGSPGRLTGDADGAARGERRVAASGQAEGRGSRRHTGRSGRVSGTEPPDPGGAGSQGRESAGRRLVSNWRTTPDAESDGRPEGRTESARLVGGPDAPVSGATAADAEYDCPGCGDVFGEHHDPGGVLPYSRRRHRRTRGATQRTTAASYFCPESRRRFNCSRLPSRRTQATPQRTTYARSLDGRK